MSKYIPEELADLQRYMTLQKWKQIEHHITYHPHHTKAVLNLEADPYQAILTSEGCYWHFCTTDGGKYWLTYQVGKQGYTSEMIQDEIRLIDSDTYPGML